NAILSMAERLADITISEFHSPDSCSPPPEFILSFSTPSDIVNNASDNSSSDIFVTSSMQMGILRSQPIILYRLLLVECTLSSNSWGLPHTLLITRCAVVLPVPESDDQKLRIPLRVVWGAKRMSGAANAAHT